MIFFPFGKRKKKKYKWVSVPPWDGCPDCQGTGRVEIEYEGSGEYIKCPCTLEIIEDKD